MPVIRLKNLLKNDGFGKCSSSAMVGEQVAVFQQHLRFEDDGLVDPLHDGTSADVADD